MRNNVCVRKRCACAMQWTCAKQRLCVNNALTHTMFLHTQCSYTHNDSTFQPPPHFSTPPLPLPPLFHSLFSALPLPNLPPSPSLLPLSPSPHIPPRDNLHSPPPSLPISPPSSLPHPHIPPTQCIHTIPNP